MFGEWARHVWRVGAAFLASRGRGAKGGHLKAIQRDVILGAQSEPHSRAPGSVKVRAGGESPRPGRLGGRLIRWNSGTDGESPDGRKHARAATAGVVRPRIRGRHGPSR